ncbi:MAG: DUF6524 family protein [Minwuiales bacterium]|nr:DUF6524 family protein [Minwuiales bacterium]
MAYERFDFKDFLIRWAIALVLVFATFNPTQYSYFRWVMDIEGGMWPLKLLAGVVLLILYVIFLRATWRSIGPIGLTLAAAFFGALIWVFVDFGWLNVYEPTIMTYVLLFVLATILAIGLSWSHVRRRIAGQSDVDDVDD